MPDRQDIVNSFPSSLSNYKIYVIYQTLRGNRINPCDSLYEQSRSDRKTEEIVEELAFDYTERVKFFLDIKNHIYSSRRMNNNRMVNWLIESFGYDVSKCRSFVEDSTSLFLMLFNETYQLKENEMSEKFLEARVASHQVSQKEDRMTKKNDDILCEELGEKIEQFEESVNLGSGSRIKAHTYQTNSDTTILLRQESGRTVEQAFDSSLDVKYFEHNPIRENAVRFTELEDGVRVQTSRSPNSWEDSLSMLFSHICSENIYADIAEVNTSKTEEIIDNVAETSNVIEPVVSTIEEGAKQEDTARANNIKITGIEIDSEDQVLEFSSENGIQSLIDDVPGVSKTIQEAISSVNADDIQVFAQLPGADSEDTVVIGKDGWNTEGRNLSVDNVELLQEIL